MPALFFLRSPSRRASVFLCRYFLDASSRHKNVYIVLKRHKFKDLSAQKWLNGEYIDTIFDMWCVPHNEKGYFSEVKYEHQLDSKHPEYDQRSAEQVAKQQRWCEYHGFRYILRTDKIIRQNKLLLNNYKVYNKWPTVHLEHRDETFEKRKRAVELYLDNNCTLEEINEQTGISRKEINKFVHKCLKRDVNGRIWGFRALLSNRRTGTTYERISSADGMKQVNFTGAFAQLLEKYPQLNALIEDHIIRRRKRAAADKVICIKDLRDKLLILCCSLDVKLNEYPFNTKDKGLRSLQRYVTRLINENIMDARHRFGEDSARKIRRLTGEMSTKDLENVPLKVVQFDGHKIDALLTVTFKNAYGDDVTEVMKRIWLLLLIIDEATRVVLGYHLCLNSEYSLLDVLHCIKKAIMPWQPFKFTIPGFKYPDTACFHSMIPEAEWAVWSELKYDHGNANLANIVKNKLTEITNCSVNPGPVAFPEARAIIERFLGF